MKTYIPQKNPALSVFLKSKRLTAGLTQENIATKLGYSASVHYSYLEKNGRLPKKKQHREIIARLLKVTVEELLEKEQCRPEDEMDILPLLRIIVANTPNEMALSDIRFLLRREASLKRSLMQHEIRRLIDGRRTSTSGTTLSVVQNALAA